ncbi:MAG: hypothetical protein Q9M18_05935 [Mariprofundaceae bacterium]|nr:hypothetical protein [Mariprofundaceae bacterium]
MTFKFEIPEAVKKELAERDAMREKESKSASLLKWDTNYFNRLEHCEKTSHHHNVLTKIVDYAFFFQPIGCPVLNGKPQSPRQTLYVSPIARQRIKLRHRRFFVARCLV